jgi:fructose-1-phosphate kinase PfkB-like protein
MTPPIHTLTGNLLAEHTFTFAAWEPGRTQRATGASFQAGGKGLNVSRMLRRLGVKGTAVTFAGGESGAACLGWMTQAGLDLQVFPSAQSTRTGLVVRAAGRAETTFLGPDASPGSAALTECATWLAAQADGGVLAVCGSLPGWDQPDFDPLRTELARWAVRGQLVADTYGPPLAWLVTQPLALVKINADEFRTLLGGAASTPDALAAARTRWPVRRWVITSGPGEVWYQDESGPPGKLVPPPVVEVSATGSGDVLLAAILAGWLARGQSLRDAVAAGLPLAAANAAHPGIAEFPLPDGF